MKTARLTILFLMVATLQAWPQRDIDLSGDYTVKTGNEVHKIHLPGTLDMAEIGEPTTLSPSLDKAVLKHLTRKVSYTGEAAYERDIDIGANTAGKPLKFSFERVMWLSRLTIDGKEVGEKQESLCTPHEFLLPDGLTKGTHHICLTVDNRKQYDISYEDMAHAYTNETQTMWNGVLGKMTMRVLPVYSIEDVQVYPDVQNKCLRIRTQVVYNKGYSKFRMFYSLKTPSGKLLHSKFQKFVQKENSTIMEFTYPLGRNLSEWDEQHPGLYTLTVGLQNGPNSFLDIREVSFGMRDLRSDHGYLELNGRRIFLRGTLECCIFPLTGCPPTDEAGWEKVFSSARDWGLNHLRFHSWCPPDAAFRTADKMGFYLQVELPVWSLKIGDDPKAEAFLMREFQRISRFYGNHPSFCLMTCGNELQHDFNVINAFVSKMQAEDPRHLYAATSFTFEKGHGGHPEANDQFFVTQWTDKGWVRGQGVFEENPPSFRDTYDSTASGWNVPLISHEIGQYSVYPDLSEISKYTGTLLPLNLQGIAADLQSKGLLSRADDYLQASGHLAGILYKEEIERALKTKDFSGFQLLGLQDFPGQSTALVGLVNAFWESKGVYDADTFRQFCAPVVPLACYDKATYTADEQFTADIRIANYSPESLKGQTVIWTLIDEQGEHIGQGSFKVMEIPQGSLTDAGAICCGLKDVVDASKLTLSISLAGTDYKNSWDIWVYNQQTLPDDYEGIVFNNPDAAIRAAREGKNVILSMKPEDVNGIEGKFLPVFWSPVHFPNQAGTMGLLINPNHPAYRHFPTACHSDWQWWSIVKRSRAMILDQIQGATPILELVDNFVNNRRLASIFETRIGKGKLIVCSIDLLTPDTNGGKYKTCMTPEIRQLLYSLVEYLQSDDCQPEGEISESQLRSLFTTRVP